MTKDQLIDLLFDELESEAKSGLLAEVEGCPECQAQYRSMADTLLLFDQAADVAMPEEEYWPGYEARLRVKLAEDPPAGAWQRLRDWMVSLGLGPSWSLPAMAGLLLLALGIGWWINTRRTGGPEPDRQAATEAPPVLPRQKDEGPHQPGDRPAPGPGPNLNQERPRLALNEKGNRSTLPRAPEGRHKRGNAPDPLVASRDQRPAPWQYLTPEMINHIEQSQLLLRSFKNASFAEDDTAFDLAYEKDQTRRLLSQNMALRRGAEAKGNLPAEELLSSIEPFLLDIANLPDEPAPEELRSIQERIQKEEIVAVLQVYSMGNMVAINHRD